MTELALHTSLGVISGRLQKLFDITVSKNTLYRYIRRDRLAGGGLYLQLPHWGKRYRYDAGEPQRSAIPDRVGIEHRSDEAELKRHLVVAH
ncbi:hypothetical protein [Candidatus Erwinia dacicola]|uniref:hypothetical protein n=1 Tax=Candidatus Erwinia dacicola TaxID=252393 RepID=UPI0011D07928|nr:hypothetical protein [Candidatus Erwinia dacicola]